VSSLEEVSSFLSSEDDCDGLPLPSPTVAIACPTSTVSPASANNS